MKKSMKKFSFLTLLAGLTMVITACGGGSDPTVNPTDGPTDTPTETPTVSPTETPTEEFVDVTEINAEIDKNSIKIGETAQITASVLPNNATDKSISYSSTSEVSVDNNGLVTGLAAGVATVTVTSNSNPDIKKDLTVNVKDPNDKSNLGFNDFVNELENSPYATNTLSGDQKYGLSNPETVGVIKDLIKEEYPIPAADEFEQIIVVDEIGLSSINTYFANGIENDYYRIATAFEMSKSVEGLTKISFATDKIYDVDVTSVSEIGAQVFTFEGLKDVYVEGNNSTIKVNYPSLSYKGFFNIKNSENIHFNDIKMELAVPSSATGVVSAANVNDKTITIDVDPEFSPLIDRVIEKGSKNAIRSWVEFHYQTKAPLQGGNFVVDGISGYTIEGDSTTGYKIKATFKSTVSRPRNGTFVAFAFSQYDSQGINLSNSKDVYIENVTMHNAPGMGLVASSLTNFYVNRFNLVIKEGSKQLMTATADAMHYVLCHGDVKVTNSLIENSHDDALNIKHGYWYKLTDAVGGSTKQMTVSKITSAIEMPKVGDKLAVYEELTFESHNPTQGYYTIKEIEETTNGFKFTVNERMANVGEWGISRVTFMSDTPNFTFANNIIRNKRNRGILVQVPNAIVRNNTFMNVGHGSIQAASAMDIYNEATMPQGIQISNNKFINNCYIKPEPLYGDISIFAISSNASVAPAGTLHDISIENNFVSRNGNAAVSLRGVGTNSNIKNNLFNECSQSQPSGDTFNTVFHMYNVQDVTLEGNYNHYTLGNGQCGIMTEGRTVESGITLVDNTNIKFFVNEDAGPVVEIAKATGSITIDGDIDEWKDAGATNVDIIGVSDAEGNERTQEELKDHFAIKSLMLTHDDNGIYIGFDIFDDYIDVKTVNDFWLGDCVEIFMSSIVDMPNADMQVYKDEGGVLQAAFASRWDTSNYTAVSDVRTNAEYIKNKGLILAKVVLTTDGYAGEILIPYTLAPEFKEAVDNGNPIDMAIVVADAERTNLGIKRVQMANVPHFVESYKTKTARMPQYIFK